MAGLVAAGVPWGAIMELTPSEAQVIADTLIDVRGGD